MTKYCPECGGEIIPMEDKKGMRCSDCDWKIFRPKPPTPPPPRRMNDYFGIMVEVEK